MPFKVFNDNKTAECVDCGCLMPNNVKSKKIHTCTPTALLNKATEKLEIKPNKEEEMEEKSLVISQVLQETMSLGDVFIKSGMFPDLKSQAQAVVKILAGKELGLSPLQSITDIYIVNGKVALQAKVIASLIKKSNKYDYHIDKLDNEECIISFFQLNGKMEKIGESIFTMKDAAKAGIVNKDVWKNYPRNMLFSRAISNGGRLYCADVITAYTTEELEEIKPIEVTTKKEA